MDVVDLEWDAFYMCYHFRICLFNFVGYFWYCCLLSNFSGTFPKKACLVIYFFSSLKALPRSLIAASLFFNLATIDSKKIFQLTHAEFQPDHCDPLSNLHQSFTSRALFRTCGQFFFLALYKDVFKWRERNDWKSRTKLLIDLGWLLISKVKLIKQGLAQPRLEDWTRPQPTKYFAASFPLHWVDKPICLAFDGTLYGNPTQRRLLNSIHPIHDGFAHGSKTLFIKVRETLFPWTSILFK